MFAILIIIPIIIITFIVLIIILLWKGKVLGPRQSQRFHIPDLYEH